MQTGRTTDRFCEHDFVREQPADLDASRAAIGDRGLVPSAAAHLTAEIASRLPFESLGAFKTLLKTFFSHEPWTADHRRALDDLVAPVVIDRWWEHDLGGGLGLTHGIRDGRYVLYASGAADAAESIFDRAFTGPVIPEATPHPRKVKFTFGGRSRAGIWVRRGDPERLDDDGVERLFAESDVTDVMVAGDFITIGLAGKSSWAERLEPILDLVTDLFEPGDEPGPHGGRTRDEMMQEASKTGGAPPDADLHLLDPQEPDQRRHLQGALEGDDARSRRIAVALLAEAEDLSVAADAVAAGYADPSRLVRRTAVDAAAEAGRRSMRPFLEGATRDGDPWIRWRAAKALGALGAAPSREVLEQLTRDPEFRVRFEAERVLRTDSG